MLTFTDFATKEPVFIDASAIRIVRQVVIGVDTLTSLVVDGGSNVAVLVTERTAAVVCAVEDARRG